MSSQSLRASEHQEESYPWAWLVGTGLESMWAISEGGYWKSPYFPPCTQGLSVGSKKADRPGSNSLPTLLAVSASGEGQPGT